MRQLFLLDPLGLVTAIQLNKAAGGRLLFLCCLLFDFYVMLLFVICPGPVFNWTDLSLFDRLIKCSYRSFYWEIDKRQRAKTKWLIFTLETFWQVGWTKAENGSKVSFSNWLKFGTLYYEDRRYHKNNHFRRQEIGWQLKELHNVWASDSVVGRDSRQPLPFKSGTQLEARCGFQSLTLDMPDHSPRSLQRTQMQIFSSIVRD